MIKKIIILIAVIAAVLAAYWAGVMHARKDVQREQGIWWLVCFAKEVRVRLNTMRECCPERTNEVYDLECRLDVGVDALQTCGAYKTLPLQAQGELQAIKFYRQAHPYDVTNNFSWVSVSSDMIRSNHSIATGFLDSVEQTKPPENHGVQ